MQKSTPIAKVDFGCPKRCQNGTNGAETAPKCVQKVSNPSKIASISMQYVDHSGNASQIYPHNPNGSENAAAAICDDTGRVTIMMPHPERVFRAVQNSWYPNNWDERSPWMRMFDNAREWIK